MSDDRRRSTDGEIMEISNKLTGITTMLEINFHPETGHVTKMLEKHDKKISEHDTDINRAKWTLGLLGLIGVGSVRSWLKQQGWIA